MLSQFYRHPSLSQKYFIGLFLLSALFLVWPELDLLTANLFYTPEKETFGFTRNFDQDIKDHRKKIILYMYYVAAAPIIALILHLLMRKKIWSRNGKIHLFFVISLIIGPILITNVILKENWGRARPYQTENFQRDKIFTPAWVPSTQCQRNCSFVSGDVSFAAWFTVFLFFIKRRRWKILMGSMITSLIIYMSYMRVSMGAHFLSDVILATYFTVGVNYFCYWFFVTGDFRHRLKKSWHWLAYQDKRYQRYKNR